MSDIRRTALRREEVLRRTVDELEHVTLLLGLQRNIGEARAERVAHIHRPQALDHPSTPPHEHAMRNAEDHGVARDDLEESLATVLRRPLAEPEHERPVAHLSTIARRNFRRVVEDDAVEAEAACHVSGPGTEHKHHGKAPGG